ncbi:nucleotidyl transferase AbiEii/AbiGii toxin family protein [Microlunatus parietis]|uniref:Nucleotidyl transferase AbiEii toxin, Type IV TA system n=1 Tax=Microlunatus parietis TaxID=682979 RepID=A0A7Y9IAU9_9ACTN|nr:nucleotidyl transferase AbiEii/AbiGii toxin family protein [Microlunatus parietis]NYE73526.1 hypothetical protein [Microlunatus parietis]
MSSKGDQPATVSDGFQYSTATAFHRALLDRFKAIAKSDPRYSVNQLQRHFAYDRVLARCFTAPDADLWVLKGAGALLSRLQHARHSRDLDLYYADSDHGVEHAAAALRAALDRDIGDRFNFSVSRIVPLLEEAKGCRVHLAAMLGRKEFSVFHVDVVVTTAMTLAAERAAPLTPVQIDGLVRPDYRVFPIVDHLADKLCAMVSTHVQQGRVNASSRVKDLVDIALIARSHRMAGVQLRRAIVTGFAFRGMTMPARFQVPDPVAWRAGYPKSAASAPAPVPSYEDAVDLATRLLDPVLAGRVEGTWEPEARQWRDAK